jgi:hypothetical protein
VRQLDQVETVAARTTGLFQIGMLLGDAVGQFLEMIG